MHGRGFLTAIIILAVAISAVPVSAKGPFKITIYAAATSTTIAEIESSDDRWAIVAALMPDEVTYLPLWARPATWDYRIVLYFDEGLQYPWEMFYLAPRDGRPGIVYWPDHPLNPDVWPKPLLAQSANFDETITRYVGPASPQATAGEPLPILFPMATAAVMTSVLFGLALRRRRTRVRRA